MIHVHPTAQGLAMLSFEADGWFADPDSGTLSITKNNQDVASFARGEWRYCQRGEAQPPRSAP